MALVAAVMGLTDFLGDARICALAIARFHFIGNRVVVLIEAVNWYRRYDRGTADAPDTVLSLVADPTDILYHRHRETIASLRPDPEVAGLGYMPAVRVADIPAMSAA